MSQFTHGTDQRELSWLGWSTKAFPGKEGAWSWAWKNEEDSVWSGDEEEVRTVSQNHRTWAPMSESGKFCAFGGQVQVPGEARG